MNNTNLISRREFLKSFSVLAGTLPWMSILLANPSLESKVAPNDKINIGIIGIGSRGSKLLLHLKTIAEVEIVAICDDYQPHLYDGKRLTQGRARIFSDFREMLSLDGLDAVVIATPLNLHAIMTVEALKSGIHVFCEKTMALTLEDIRHVMTVQRRASKILQIGFQRLFDIRYIKALEVIRGGALGPLTCLQANWHRNDDWRRPVRDASLERRMNWRLYRESSGGLLTELAAHQLQITNWFMGTHPEMVAGTGSINYWKDGRETYDNVNLVFGYPGGVGLTYSSILSNQQYGATERFMGPLGTIELERGKIFMEKPPPSPGIYQLIHSIENRLFQTVPIGGASWVPDNPNESEGKYLVDKMEIPSATQLELEAFVKSVLSGRPIEGLLEQAYYASITSLIGLKAVSGGRVVQWPKELEFWQEG